VGLRAEPVLAAPVGRVRWAAGHLALALLCPAAALAAAGLAGGLAYGAAAGEVGHQLPRVLAGALVQAPAAWALAGVTVALFGLLPRLTVGGWAALAASALVWQLGAPLRLEQWLLDASPFTHVPRIPGGQFGLTPLLWLTASTAVLVVAGLAGFRRRDLGRV
jgi:ABC-2 type transport system permease protein